MALVDVVHYLAEVLRFGGAVGARGGESVTTSSAVVEHHAASSKLLKWHIFGLLMRSWEEMRFLHLVSNVDEALDVF